VTTLASCCYRSILSDHTPVESEYLCEHDGEQVSNGQDRENRLLENGQLGDCKSVC